MKLEANTVKTLLRFAAFQAFLIFETFFLSLLQYHAHFTAPSAHILGRRPSSLSLPHLSCTHTCIHASHRSCSLYINGVWIAISRPHLNPEFQTLISNCLLKESHKCHILLVAKTEFIIFPSISVSEKPSSIQVQVRKFGCFFNSYSSSWTRVNLRDSLFWMCHNMSLPLQDLPAQATLLDQCSENSFPSNRLSTVFSAWWIFLRQPILHTVSWVLL